MTTEIITTQWDNFLDGNFTSVVTGQLNSGLGEWWMTMLFICLIFVCYISTNDEAITAFFSLFGTIIISASDYVSNIEISPIIYLICVIMTAIFFYGAFWKGD